MLIQSVFNLVTCNIYSPSFLGVVLASLELHWDVLIVFVGLRVENNVQLGLEVLILLLRLLVGLSRSLSLLSGVGELAEDIRVLFDQAVEVRGGCLSEALVGDGEGGD